MTRQRGRRLPEWERREFIEAHGFVCAYCGAIGDRWGVGGDQWHIDHVHPVSHGGALDRANLALACGLCNTLKGSTLVADLADDLTNLGEHIATMPTRRAEWPAGTVTELAS